jgi:hypothetical protein
MTTATETFLSSLQPVPAVADLLRRRARQPAGLVVDVHGDLRQGRGVLPVVMRAEHELQTVGEQDPDVSLGTAAITAVHGGKRPGPAPVRRLAPLLPFSVSVSVAVSASGPESAFAQDDHLLRSPGSALLIPIPGDCKWENRWYLWCHRRPYGGPGHARGPLPGPAGHGGVGHRRRGLRPAPPPHRRSRCPQGRGTGRRRAGRPWPRTRTRTGRSGRSWTSGWSGAVTGAGAHVIAAVRWPATVPG